MPYKDKAKQLAFQTKWMRERRDAFFAGKSCEHPACDKAEKLMLIKRQALSSADPHFFSFSPKKQAVFAKRYRVMCKEHYNEEFKRRRRRERLGKPATPNMLSHAEVWAIRGRLMGTESARAIAMAYDVEHQTVLHIRTGRIWSWLERGSRRIHGIDRRL